jgi:glycosyltransferase involved in cell wall biosynthesis
MSLKILFVCTLESGWGGSEFLWVETAKALANRGLSVHASLAYRKPIPSVIDELKKCGVHVNIQNEPAATPPPANLLRRLSRRILRNFKAKTKPFSIHRYLHKIRPELVVISQPSSVEGYDWMIACQEIAVCYCTISHACHDHLFGNDQDAMWLKPALMGAKKSFFVCRENQKRMEYFLGQRYTNAEIVRNPYTVPYDTEFTWPRTQTVLRLANIARLHVTSKGQDVLLEAISLPKWQKRPIHLSIYGTGPNESGLKKLSELLEVSNVTFHGHVGNIQQVWQENHCLVLPSRYEGLPIALVEGMLCGRPAVVTNVSGNAEVMVSGKTGFIAAAPTAQAMDEALEELWTQKDNLKDIGKFAYEHIRTLIPADPAKIFADSLLNCLDAR